MPDIILSTVSATIISDTDLLNQGVPLQEENPELQEPTVDASSYVLIDNDAKNCRVIDQDEFTASFVDNNIVKCYLADFSPFEETLDNEYLVVNYQNGHQIQIQFGLIDAQPGVFPAEYAKTGGLIYPIDESGVVLLNDATTPTLMYTRDWVINQWKEASQENLQMAELVNAFVQAGFAPVSSLDGVHTPSIIAPGG
jgi:hypothetical protein